MFDFGQIMEGFMKAQIDAQRRGDFSPQAGVDYLNGVNDALQQQINHQPAEGEEQC